MARLSTRLVINALSTYARLGGTFLLGIFLTWYLVGQVGLEVFGLISIAIGTFGLSSAVEAAIEGCLNREFAASIATGDERRVRRTFNSSLPLAAGGACVILLVSGALATIASFGLFRTPVGVPGMRSALALLFISEGAYLAIRLLAAPYRQALFGDRRVGTDNLLRLLSRVMWSVSAVLTFGVLTPHQPVHVQLYWFALIHAIFLLTDVIIAVVLARRTIKGLEFKRGVFDREECGRIARSSLQVAQHLILMDFSPQFIAVLINLFYGVAYNGIWQIAVQVFGHARLLAEGILQGLDPIATHLKENRQDELIRTLMVRSIRYQLAIALPWVVTYLVFMQPILHLWVGGRLSKDENLAKAGIAVSEAIDLIGVIAAGCLVAMLCRVTTRGVERVLYGLGHIDSYAWFARWSLLIVVGLTTVVFFFSETPWLAGLGILVANFCYYDLVVLRAARRRLGFDGTGALAASVPRPLLAALILLVPLFFLRQAMPTLTLPSLIGLVAVVSASSALLVLLIVLVPDERVRVFEMVRRLKGRALRP